MEDYCFGLSGLPQDAIDPIEIQRWVEEKFGRPIEGVSICYDIRGKQNCLGFNNSELRTAIGKKLDDHLQVQEEAFTAALGVPRSRREALRHSPSRLPALSEETETTSLDGRSETHAWLSAMRCSGEAFVVMKQEADVETFFSRWDQPRGLQRTGSFFSFHDGSPVPNSSPQSWKKTRRDRTFRGYELEIREVTSEPTSIIWEHMGTTHLQLAMRICIGLIGFLLAIAVFYGGVCLDALQKKSHFFLGRPRTASKSKFCRKARGSMVWGD